MTIIVVTVSSQSAFISVRVQCEIATVLSRFDVKALSDLVVKSNVSIDRNLQDIRSL